MNEQDNICTWCNFQHGDECPRETWLLRLTDDFDNLALRAVISDFLLDQNCGLFVAIKTGHYRHEIIGAFRRLDAAIHIAEAFIVHEKDHYHSVEIVECQLNQPQKEKVVLEIAWLDPGRVWIERIHDRRVRDVRTARTKRKSKERKPQ